jgi:hypothetical protein
LNNVTSEPIKNLIFNQIHSPLQPAARTFNAAHRAEVMAGSANRPSCALVCANVRFKIIAGSTNWSIL